ncbi:GPI anchored protein [Aspergillus sp. HF37]|nr:GPI anchored protein [Aspergillus sp. HF37]
MRAAIYFVRLEPLQYPRGGYSFTAGEPTTLSWKSNTKGTVSLILQHGTNFMPKDGHPIATYIPNVGEYTWEPPSDLPDRDDYTIEIYSNWKHVYNFTPRFSIAGLDGGSSSSSASSSAPSSSTPMSSTQDSSSMESSTMASSSMQPSSSSSSSSTTTMAETSSSAMSSSPAESSTSATASMTATDSSAASSSGAAQTAAPTGNVGVVNRASGGLTALIVGVVAAM